MCLLWDPVSWSCLLIHFHLPPLSSHRSPRSSLESFIGSMPLYLALSCFLFVSICQIWNCTHLLYQQLLNSRRERKLIFLWFSWKSTRLVLVLLKVASEHWNLFPTASQFHHTVPCTQLCAKHMRAAPCHSQQFSLLNLLSGFRQPVLFVRSMRSKQRRGTSAFFSRPCTDSDAVG